MQNTRAPRFRIFVATILGPEGFSPKIWLLSPAKAGVVDWGKDVGDSKSNSTKKIRNMLRH